MSSITDLQRLGIETYSAPELSKSGLSVVVCGDKGSGKSSLIDRLRELIVENTENAGADGEFIDNTVTDACKAGLAAIVVDAETGISPQTRRCCNIVSLLRIRHVVLVVNKMDRISFSEKAFVEIESGLKALAKQVGLGEVDVIPLSALRGDNVRGDSLNMSWYRRSSLLQHLETAVRHEESSFNAFRMPVQRVDETNRTLSGTVVEGSVKPGARIRIASSGNEATVTRIVGSTGDFSEAVQGQSISLELDSDIAVQRGDVLASGGFPLQVADQFQATLIWLNDDPMLQGRTYGMKTGARTVLATIAPLKYRINPETSERYPAEKLELRDIGVAEIELSQPIPFQPYEESRALGSFTIIDRVTNETVGLGLLDFALRRAANVHWQTLDVTKGVRSKQKGQRACVVWFTGLSGAGKSTIANLVEKRLVWMDRHTYLLDGDNVRHGLNKDLGFTAQDRVENIRRVAEVAKLMADAGLIVLASFISPFRIERRMVRELMEPGEFVEVFVHAPLDVAERRDPKGLYKKARRGELRNFTGIDSPYEVPERPEVRIDTTAVSANDAADQIIDRLVELGLLENRRVAP